LFGDYYISINPEIYFYPESNLFDDLCVSVDSWVNLKNFFWSVGSTL